MRTLSGVQPSGNLHIGNYFGAVRQFVELQEQGDCYFFIADLHALTSVRDADRLRQLRMQLAVDYLALGLDPERTTLFVQSDIPEVTELTWILLTLTPVGLLQRAHSYKDKVAKGLDADAGLFTYPILQAADILVYDSDRVPVGKDQVQHLEITRDVAISFNTTYCKDFDPVERRGGVLRIPEAYVQESTAVVPGIDGQKMSKSYGNTIDLFAPDKELKKTIMRIVTDSTPLEEPKNPDTCNVYAFLKLFCTEAELADIRELYTRGGTGYGHFKTTLLDKFHELFDPARAKRAELMENLDHVRGILHAGAAKARTTAREVLERVKHACGVDSL